LTDITEIGALGNHTCLCDGPKLCIQEKNYKKKINWSILHCHL